MKRPVILDQVLDGPLGGIGELVSITVEQFDAVVVKRIVGCGNHDAGFKAVGCSKMRYPRCGQHTGQVYVFTHGADTGRKRADQHVSRNPRVLSDDKTAGGLFLIIEISRDGPSRFKRGFTVQRKLVGYSSDAVGSKKFAQ